MESGALARAGPRGGAGRSQGPPASVRPGVETRRPGRADRARRPRRSAGGAGPRRRPAIILRGAYPAADCAGLVRRFIDTGLMPDRTGPSLRTSRASASTSGPAWATAARTRRPFCSTPPARIAVQDPLRRVPQPGVGPVRFAGGAGPGHAGGLRPRAGRAPLRPRHLPRPLRRPCLCAPLRPRCGCGRNASPTASRAMRTSFAGILCLQNDTPEGGFHPDDRASPAVESGGAAGPTSRRDLSLPRAMRRSTASAATGSGSIPGTCTSSPSASTRCRRTGKVTADRAGGFHRLFARRPGNFRLVLTPPRCLPPETMVSAARRPMASRSPR